MNSALFFIAPLFILVLLAVYINTKFSSTNNIYNNTPHNPEPFPPTSLLFSAYTSGTVLFTLYGKIHVNIYARLYDISSGKIVASFFVRQSESISFLFPIGTYSLKYTYGFVWFGTDLMFGDNSYFFQSKNNLIFSEIDSFTKGHVVNLANSSLSDSYFVNINHSSF